MGNIRAQRGYAFERRVVGVLNSAGWKARRLGSPSIALPDVLAINNQTKTVCAIECKSGIATSLTVPADQIARCAEMVDDLMAYENRLVILTFKFAGKLGGRKLLYRSLLWDGREPEDVRCSYDGTVMIGGKTGSLEEAGFI